MSVAEIEVCVKILLEASSLGLFTGVSKAHVTVVIVCENFVPCWRIVIGLLGKIKLLAGPKCGLFGDCFIVRRVTYWMRLNFWLRIFLDYLKVVRELFCC